MKIAIILPSLRNVGPVKVALNIIESLIKKSDIELTVFYIKNSIELIFPCEVKKLSIRNIFSLYKYDVIHSHMLRPDVITSLLPFFHGKKISTIHNIVDDDLYFTHGKFISKLFSIIWVNRWKKFDNIVVLSKTALEFYVKKGLPSEKLSIIYNGMPDCLNSLNINKSDENKILEFSKNKKIIGSMCLFNKRKGLDQIITALPLLENYCLILIGDGPIKNELLELARIHDVSDRVLFLGYRENAKCYLNIFDIYAMPSRSEGFSLALIEAASAAMPIVCSNIDVFKEAFEPDEVSFFELDNINSFIEEVSHLPKTKGLMAREKYLKEYTVPIMANKYFSLYNK
ncbi:glycosyltransferase [Morganella morganii subsp. morganii]|uniref:glycosyltransferase n=1 Tax=Morganella morganii TaxID=582 RepID=UPI001BDB4574|nr:glycosyltransferase [Morganella morganii]MBT0395901.1 glycosyltransferase [Morganella morganii subsp. morganii]